MKVRIPVQNTNGFKGNAQYLGLDTSEIVGFRLGKDNDLHLQYRGTPNPVVITEKEIGAKYFADLLTVICSEFQHIDDVQSQTNR